MKRAAYARPLAIAIALSVTALASRAQDDRTSVPKAGEGDAHYEIASSRPIVGDAVLSRDGSRVVWGERAEGGGTQVYAASFDGSARKPTGRWETALTQLAVSPDGSRVLYGDAFELRDAAWDGAASRSLIRLDAPQIVASSYDGGAPRFQIGMDARRSVENIWLPIQRGLFGIDEAGRPVQIVGPVDVARVVGGSSRQVVPFGLPQAGLQLAAERDGRIVFGIHSRRDRFMAYQAEDGLRRIVSNVGELLAVGIGARGATLFFVARSGGTETAWLVDWDGRKRRRVPPPHRGPFEWSGLPLQLDASGRFFNLGTGLVIDLERGVPISLLAALAGGRDRRLARRAVRSVRMDGGAARFAYLARAGKDRFDVATLELSVPLVQRPGHTAGPERPGASDRAAND